MNPTDMQIEELNKRIESIEKIDLDERLSYIEKKLNECIYACKYMSNAFEKGIPISLEKESIKIASEFKESAKSLRDDILIFSTETKKMKRVLEGNSVVDAMKFMAKKLNDLEEQMRIVKEEGIKKEIHLAVTCDGYEMTKKKPKILDDIPEQEMKPEEVLDALLKNLTQREKIVLTHRFGLYGYKKQTLAWVGKEIGIDRERVRQIEMKALRRLRSPNKEKLLENLTHKDLRKALIGE